MTGYETEDGLSKIPGSGIIRDGALWALSTYGRRLIKLDPGNGTKLLTVSLGKNAWKVFSGTDGIWVTAASLLGGGSLYRVDPGTGKITADHKMKWVRDVRDGVIFRTDKGFDATVLIEADEATGVDLRATPIAPGFWCMEIGAGSLWLLHIDKEAASFVTRMNRETMTEVARMDLGDVPHKEIVFAALVFAQGAIWLNVGALRGGSVIRIDPETNQVAAVIEVGKTPHPVVAWSGSIWVSTSAHDSRGDAESPILRIDPASNQIIDRYILYPPQPWLIPAADAVLAIHGPGINRID